MSDWKEYEKAVSNYLEKYYEEEHFEVEHDRLLYGNKSKSLRQIDVLSTDSNGNYIISECKHHKRKIGINIIGAFWSKLNDINVFNGIIFSSVGFTRQAINFANYYNIDLVIYPFDRLHKYIEHGQQDNANYNQAYCNVCYNAFEKTRTQFSYTDYFIVERCGVRYFIYYGMCSVDHYNFYCSKCNKLTTVRFEPETTNTGEGVCKCGVVFKVINTCDCYDYVTTTIDCV